MTALDAVHVTFRRTGFDPRLLARSVRRDGLVIGLILSYVAMVLIVTGESPLAILRELPMGLLLWSGMTAVVAVAARSWHYLRVERPASPIGALCRDAAEAIRAGRIERWLPLAVAGSLFVIAFTRLKSAIPDLAGGFTWDRTFFELDRALHGGVSPWEWLQPWLGFPLPTFLLGLNYSLWFPLMWAVFFVYQNMAQGAEGRTRFILVFVLLWAIGGGLFAVLFASAGPCFYGHVVPGDDPYAPLMAYLHAADAVLPIGALDIQRLLWLDHETSRALGVSAMPSLHNATAMLMVLASRRFGPRIRGLFVAHAVMIFLGSIHLGWHYAVDAYVSFALAIALWWGVKPLADRWDRRIRAGSMSVTCPPVAASLR